MDRTAFGLRETLFDTLEGLLNGSINRLDAREVCTIAARVLDTVRMERMELELIRASHLLEQEMSQHQITSGEEIISVGA